MVEFCLVRDQRALRSNLGEPVEHFVTYLYEKSFGRIEGMKDNF